MAACVFEPAVFQNVQKQLAHGVGGKVPALLAGKQGAIQVAEVLV
jgi:hypothetical protein